MKRFLALLITLALAGTLAACGGTKNGQNDPDMGQTSQEEAQSEKGTSAPESSPPISSTDDEVAPSAEEEAARVLIAYFSATGNTEGIAAALQEILDADLYEIVPAEPYTDQDLAYNTDDCRANQEQNDPDARPAISAPLETIEGYDVIFLGYPIWWGQAPKIIYTFLESCDFGDIVIVPFCTSGSSGIDGSVDDLHALAPEADWLEGRRFSAGADEEELTQWVEELDLPALPGETN